MNKLFTKIAGAFMGIAMAIGVGAGISFRNSSAKEVGAATATFAPSDFSGQGTSGTGSEISATVDGVTFACNAGYGTTQFRCYKNSTITISSSNTITALSFSYNSGYSGGLESSYTNLSTTSWTKTLTSQARLTGCTVTYSGGGTYSVTYNGNGSTSGSVPTDNTAYSSGATVTVKGNLNSLAKTTAGLNFSFDGWNTKADGSGTNRAVGSTFSISENTTLYAKWADPAPDSGAITYSLGSHSSFSSWSSSYSSRTLSYTEDSGTINVVFASANKQTTTITDVPVTKGGNVEFKLVSNTRYISAITFYAKQWGTNAQTINLYGSTNGGSTYASTSLQSSTIFKIRASSLAVGTNAIKVTFSNSSYQVGIDKFIVTYADIPVTQATGVSFDPASLSLDGGVQGSFTPTLTGGVGNYSKTINWTSSHPLIIPAPSSSTDGTKIYITPATVAADTEVTLTATVASPGSATGSIVITVKLIKSVVVTGVSISGITDDSALDGENDDSVYIGATIPLEATVAYQSGAAYKDGNNSVTWESSDDDVATVDTDGTVTLCGNGDVTISATSVENDNYSASVSFSVANIIDPPGSVTNPFTVAQAIEAVIDNGSTPSTETYYAVGYIMYIDGNNIWIADDIHDDSAKTSLLEGYNSSAPTDLANVDYFDRVVISGKLQYYSKNSQPEFSSYDIVSYDNISAQLSLSLATDTLVVNSDFTYNGTITGDYTNYDDEELTMDDVTFSGDYDMSVVGEYTITVSWDCFMYDTDRTATYTLNVIYADLTNFQLSEHARSISLNDSSIDLDDITVTVNENANPAFSWSLISAKDTSNNNMVAGTDYTYNSSTHAFSSKDTPGTVVFHAISEADSNVYDVFTITITGNPIVNLSSDTVNGIATTSGSISVSSVENMIEPYTYVWSVTTGNDVVSATSGSSSSTLSFLKAGTASVQVTVTDKNGASKTASASVNVIKSLNAINYTTQDSWELVTNVNQLSEGTEVIFVGTNNSVNYAMGTYSSGNNVPASSTKVGNTTTYNTLTISDGVIESGITSDMIYTLAKDNSCGDNVYAFKDSTTTSDKYLYAVYPSGTTTSNHMKSQNVIDEKGRFEISISEGIFTIKVVDSTNRGNLGFNYNSGSPMFSCYTSTSAFADTAKLYRKIPGDTTNIANINYNAQKAVIEFAEALTSNLNTVCDQSTGNTQITGDDGLNAMWTTIAGVYTSKRGSLTASDRIEFDKLIANATASDAQNADVLEKALSSYNYVYSKYGENLTSGDFLSNSGRAHVVKGGGFNPISIFGSNSNNMIPVIVVISMISVTAVGGYFFLRKRKED